MLKPKSSEPKLSEHNMLGSFGSVLGLLLHKIVITAPGSVHMQISRTFWLTEFWTFENIKDYAWLLYFSACFLAFWLFFFFSSDLVWNIFSSPFLLLGEEWRNLQLMAMWVIRDIISNEITQKLPSFSRPIKDVMCQNYLTGTERLLPLQIMTWILGRKILFS